MLKDNKKIIHLILCFLFFSNILAWIIVFDLSRTNFLEVIFFDVNQGESIYIQTPQNHQILIDGGPDSKILEKLKEKIPFWDKTIDLLILTHPESDHLNGFLEVLKKYKVENILWTGVIKKTAEFKEWLALTEREGAKIKFARAGQKIFCENCNWEIKILYPLENFSQTEFEDTNQTSIVLKLIFYKTSFLFTGDIYQSDEEKIIKQYSLSDVESISILKSDVLKIAHHGSKSSNSEEFIKKISPQFSVISVGKNNRYGHPHQEILERLNKFGIKILRTDSGGDIKFISDGENLITNN